MSIKDKLLGATGRFPQGSYGKHDEGELRIGIARDRYNNVRIDFGKPVTCEEPYWEISGPRKYLNIPTTVPDRWRAEVTVGEFPDYRTFVGWGPTEQDAKDRAMEAALHSSRRKDG